MLLGDTPISGEVDNYGVYDSAKDELCHSLHSKRVCYADTEEISQNVSYSSSSSRHYAQISGIFSWNVGLERRQAYGRRAFS